MKETLERIKAMIEIILAVWIALWIVLSSIGLLCLGWESFLRMAGSLR